MPAGEARMASLETIGVIAAGMMGHGVAEDLAQHGSVPPMYR
jgi:3-hydroxyacyl-CoA dehydrogenase